MADTNPFAQFDTQAPAAVVANPFDQFDTPHAPLRITVGPNPLPLNGGDPGGTTGGTVPVDRSNLPAAIADIPGEIKNAVSENAKAINAGLNPFSEDYQKAHESQFGGLAATGQGLLAVPGMAAAPITGTVRSVIGHTFADALHGVGSVIAPETAAQDDPAKLYDIGKGVADTAQLALGARPGLGPRPIGVAPTPVPDVLLSQGQSTGNLGLIKQEQKAAAGDLGTAAQERAKQFNAQQAGQVQNANDVVAKSFDQFNQNIAQNPRDAGAIAQQGLQQARNVEKAAVTNKYQTAGALGGKIDSSAFLNMGGSIRSDLTGRPEPVIIDDKLTPWANQAIGEIDKASNFNIPNAANPAGAPNPSQVRGVSLEGLEQVRKRLSELRRGAWANNASDGRATSAVLDAFDDHVTQAVNSGAFRGNPDAVDAWNEARASSAEFKKKFSANKGDTVGKQIEKIIGPRGGEPLTPNDVADALFGRAGTNPGSTNVGVAARVRNILGKDSPEWSAVNQGLFSRLVERGEGEAEMGPGMIANRIFKFLNSDGRDMANAVFSPAERQAIAKYGDLMRKLEVPKGATMTAGSAPLVGPILRRIGTGISYLLGAAIAHHAGFGTEGEIVGATISGKGGEMLNNWRNGRAIIRQMPMVTEAVQKFQNALATFNKANSPPSRIALSVATTNLARQLKPLGIGFDGLFPTGAAPATANQNQQQ